MPGEAQVAVRAAAGLLDKYGVKTFFDLAGLYNDEPRLIVPAVQLEIAADNLELATSAWAMVPAGALAVSGIRASLAALYDSPGDRIQDITYFDPAMPRLPTAFAVQS